MIKQKPDFSKGQVIVRVLVCGQSPNGPDAVRIRVICGSSDLNDDRHYSVARIKATELGLVAPFTVIDEFDPGRELLDVKADWSKTPLISAVLPDGSTGVTEPYVVVGFNNGSIITHIRGGKDAARVLAVEIAREYCGDDGDRASEALAMLEAEQHWGYNDAGRILVVSFGQPATVQ